MPNRVEILKQKFTNSVSLPDTQANQAAYPQHSNQGPGCGFPIAKNKSDVQFSYWGSDRSAG